MKVELTLPPELVEAIAQRVVELLKPILAHRKTETEDTIFDVQGLAEYLKVSKKWIYERTQLKEIPHIKVDGLLRFRKRDIDKWLNSFNVPSVNTSEKVLKIVK
jgi:excisionase family DNA binding protein